MESMFYIVSTTHITSWHDDKETCHSPQDSKCVRVCVCQCQHIVMKERDLEWIFDILLMFLYIYMYNHICDHFSQKYWHTFLPTSYIQNESVNVSSVIYLIFPFGVFNGIFCLFMCQKPNRNNQPSKQQQ